VTPVEASPRQCSRRQRSSIAHSLVWKRPLALSMSEFAGGQTPMMSRASTFMMSEQQSGLMSGQLSPAVAERQQPQSGQQTPVDGVGSGSVGSRPGSLSRNSLLFASLLPSGPEQSTSLVDGPRGQVVDQRTPRRRKMSEQMLELSAAIIKREAGVKPELPKLTLARFALEEEEDDAPASFVKDGRCKVCSGVASPRAWGNVRCHGCSAVDTISFRDHPLRGLLLDWHPDIRPAFPGAPASPQASSSPRKHLITPPPLPCGNNLRGQAPEESHKQKTPHRVRG